MKRFTEKALATTAFLSTLACSLVVLPLVFDNTALALDAKAGPDGAGPQRHFPLPSERVEARIAYAKVALKITDAQTKQWNAFADYMRKKAKEMDARIEAMRNGKHDVNLTIIDRLQDREKHLKDQAAATEDTLTAIKPLYAVLSDDQKQTAEELLKPEWGHGMRGHGGWGHGPDGRGPDGHGPMGPDGHRPDGHGPGGPGPAPAP